MYTKLVVVCGRPYLLIAIIIVALHHRPWCCLNLDVQHRFDNNIKGSLNTHILLMRLC